MQKIIEEIREYVHSQWMLGELHGIRHWDRVYENGKRLLAPSGIGIECMRMGSDYWRQV